MADTPYKEQVRPYVPKPDFVEVFLFFCPICKNVRLGVRRLQPGEYSAELFCNTCDKRVKHKPIAYDSASQKFVTQR